jgi:hypothetical protein
MPAHANPRAVVKRPGSQRRLACRRLVPAKRVVGICKVALAETAQRNRRRRAHVRSEHFTIEWNHLIETESLKINELEQIVVAFFRTCSSFSFMQSLKPNSAFVPLESALAPRRVELTAVRLLSRASFCVRLWCTEQKLASEVLGVKGARRWRNWGVRAANPRNRMALGVARVFANQTIKR